MDRDALRELLAKVEAGDCTEYSIFREAHIKSEWQALEGQYRARAWDAYEGSLDAAKALHEALLPGWGWLLNSRSGYALVWESKEVGDREESAISPVSNARAWLIAILSALIAEGE